jgi:hypothetical protein
MACLTSPLLPGILNLVFRDLVFRDSAFSGLSFQKIALAFRSKGEAIAAALLHKLAS